MRDVTEEEPKRALPRMERFTPEAVLVRLPEWRRRDDGGWEMLHEKTGRWDKIHPIFAAALEALREGATYEETVQRALPDATSELRENHVRIYLRRFLWQLHESGHVRLPFEEPPPVFEGRYRRLRELGRGGIGIAHLCHDEKEDRLVVVKHAWGYRQPADRADRAMRYEADIMRAFDHPNVARFYDEFEIEGVYHLVREYADGRPLGEVQRAGELRDRAARLGVLREVADVVAHVHDRGFVFLDTTPNNFVLRADGTPLVIDIGLCRPHDAGEVALRGPLGSRGYAAPEVIEGKRASLRSDVFGYGCLHHVLVAGAPPGHKWTREQRAEALAAAGAPADEAELVLACCADAEEARPVDMRDVLARLSRLARSS